MGVYVAWLESVVRAAGTFFVSFAFCLVGSRVLLGISEVKRGGRGV